jgi:hypothetical protein
MWITITEADVVPKLSAPEIAAMKSAALQVGQANPLAAVIAQVVLEIRGYVAACQGNVLGDGQTIPDELLGAAVSRIRFELATRLPAELLNEDRRRANDNALTLLRDVAACRFALVQPATAAADQPGGPAVTVVSSTTRRATRDKLAGL